MSVSTVTEIKTPGDLALEIAVGLTSADVPHYVLRSVEAMIRTGRRKSSRVNLDLLATLVNEVVYEGIADSTRIGNELVIDHKRTRNVLKQYESAA